MLPLCLQPSRPGYPSPRSSEGYFSSPQHNHFPVRGTHKIQCCAVPSYFLWAQPILLWLQQLSAEEGLFYILPEKTQLVLISKKELVEEINFK